GAAQAQPQAKPQSPSQSPSSDQMDSDGAPLDLAAMRYTAKSATLRSVQWNGMRSLPVCWENPRPEHEAKRERIRRGVAETWEAAGNVNFVGWSPCQPNEQAIRVRVSANEWPRAIVGRGALARRTTMWLNFDLPLMAGFAGCAAKVERCEDFTAIHEFGHVLGLIHEQDRPDTPDTCRQALGNGGITQRPADDLVVMSGYDPESIMNYCSVRGWDSAQPLVLTTEDKAGIVKMFGARAAAEPPSEPQPKRRRFPVFVPQ
ncbi:M12 family metallopeptidase, partial [Sandarakinorhabdus sp.]|uniref:M12 family metallopeptidase n=1 Tax=Sandarakinorhabdus sp. TaxID=1916663 RepID=UPI0033419F14